MDQVRNTLRFVISALSEPEWVKVDVTPTMKVAVGAVAGIFLAFGLKILAPNVVSDWYLYLFFKVSAPALLYVALLLIPPVVITIHKVSRLAAGHKARWSAAVGGDDIFSTLMMNGDMEKRLLNGKPERVLCQYLVTSLTSGVVEEVICRFLFVLPFAILTALYPPAMKGGDITLLFMVASAFVFTILHDNNTMFDFLYRFAGGIVLFLVFMESGLLAAVLLHIGHNAASSVSSYITKKFEAKKLKARTGIYGFRGGWSS